MTASTNTVILMTKDGEYEEVSGVLYAEEAYRTGTVNAGGVAIQYKQQPDEEEPETEFRVGADLVGVYDDISEESATESYREWVTNS
jgi:hypothetical protein